MIKLIAKWLILILLLTYATIATLWANAEAGKEKCKDIEVIIFKNNNSNFITESGVRQGLKDLNNNFSSYKICEINIDSLEKILSTDNRYEEVECGFTNQGKLRISIIPMIPELRIFSGDSSYYINKDGKHLNADINFISDVPIVKGEFNEHFTPTMLMPVSRYIQSDSILNGLIGMISASSPTNIILHPRIKGHVINLGDTTDLPTKFENLMLMYHQVMPYKGWDTYDTISVKFKGQIVAHHRNKKKKEDIIYDNEEIEIEEASLVGQDMDIRE